LAQQGRKPATLNRYRAAMSRIYSIAITNGKVSNNPARLVPLQRENNERVRWLEDKEEIAIRQAIRQHWPQREPEMDLALHTWRRRSEQCCLR